jgi:hypothetical protein
VWECRQTLTRSPAGSRLNFWATPNLKEKKDRVIMNPVDRLCPRALQATPAAASSRHIVGHHQLVFLGDALLNFFGVHLFEDNRVPSPVTFIGWYVILSGPSPQANLLNEVNLRQSRVHTCSPFVRYNRLVKETTVMTLGGSINSY